MKSKNKHKIIFSAASRVPATVRAFKQGPPALQADCLPSSISCKIQPSKTLKNGGIF